MENNEQPMPPPPPPPPPRLLRWFNNRNQRRTRLPRLRTSFPVTIIVFTTTISVPIIVTNDSIAINVDGAILNPISIPGYLSFDLTLPTGLNLPVIITIGTTTTVAHFLVHHNGTISNITYFVNTIIRIVHFFFLHFTRSYSHLLPPLPPPPSNNDHQNTTSEAITIPISISFNLNNTNNFIVIPIHITRDCIHISPPNVLGLGTIDVGAYVWFSNPRRIYHRP